jgi:hypothetical protein
VGFKLLALKINLMSLEMGESKRCPILELIIKLLIPASFSASPLFEKNFF